MGKGLAVSTVAYLVIAVIILILFMPILIRSAGAVWDKILQAVGVVKPSALEKAILCSYYRCTEGCVHSTKVTEEIKWQENGKEVSCNDFCDAPHKAGAYEGGENEVKVCGWNAMQYPVVIELDEPAPLSKNIEIEPTCIIPTDAAHDEFQKAYLEGIANNWIIVDSNFITQREGTNCDYEYSPIMKTSFNAISTATLSGKMYIFMLTEPESGKWRIDVRQTPCDITLAKDETKDVEFFSGARSINYRLICIKDSDYKAVFKFRPSMFDAYVEINGVEKKTIQNVWTEWYFEGGHRFLVKYKGETLSQPSAPNKMYFSIRYELTPIQPGCKCPGTECLPPDNKWDSWTESKDNWYSVSGYDVDSSDVKCGKYVIRLSFDGTFDVEKREGKRIDLKLYDKVHLWVKSPSNNAGFKIEFVSEVGAPKSLDCKFTLQSGWNEIWIDLKNWQQNCEKDSRYGFDWDPINRIDFYMMENRYWIDDLYFVKY